ncbi:carbohydrate porin [Sediminitomix flava]|uniref:Porin n=1 Tax=Sediminitomix flava TaxID=379075 RepID=A0A315Z546_SEDFL|nr:carbohydrate porin [Sediminitomix flava]PWJ38542.1 porin [Sediminitomix flava]
MKFAISLLIALLLFVTFQGVAQNDADTLKDFTGPAAVGNQLINDSRPNRATRFWYALDSLDKKKERFYERTGFIAGVDYNSQIMAATNVIGNTVGASGVFRIYGKWNMVKPGTNHEGGLIFKVENRHRYSDNALREYGPLDVGYAGFMQSVYNNQSWRVTNLYWRQVLGGQDKVVIYAGFVDITDWTDVYVVASPWQSFNNLVFATGSGALGGGYPDGSFGVMVNAWLTEQFYATASIVDTNGDPTEFWKGFESFFGDFETVKTLEVGYTPNGLSSAFFKNAHITFWQVDKRAEGGTPNGWGIIGSWSWLYGKYLPFVRFGWADDGLSFYDYSISAGFAYNIIGASNLGVGINLNKPNSSTFGLDLDTQYSGEFFYKWQATHHSELTPNLQLIGNPAFNTNDNFSVVFGLRARVFL